MYSTVSQITFSGTPVQIIILSECGDDDDNGDDNDNCVCS